MKPWQGYAHAGVVALSVWFSRETIFEALQWWHGRPPSDGLLLGSCILLTGFACVPIVALHFSHVMVLVLTGFLFLAIMLLIHPPKKILEKEKEWNQPHIYTCWWLTPDGWASS